MMRLDITTTVRACNRPLTTFVRCSKTEALPAQQTREWMHEETRYGVSLQQATDCICWRHQDRCREGLLTQQTREWMQEETRCNSDGIRAYGLSLIAELMQGETGDDNI